MSHPLARDFPQLANRVGKIQAERAATGCIANNGASLRSKECVEYQNAVLAWKARGEPVSEIDSIMELKKAAKL